MEKQLAELKRKLGSVSDLVNAARLLEWDQETYMPPKAAEERAQQLATISALAHTMFISDEMGEVLNELWENREKLDERDTEMLVVLRYDYARQRALPESFVHQFALETSRALPVWIDARKRSDFRLFLPQLDKIVQLNREKAELLGFRESPYDALLDEYERGMTVKQIKGIFGELALKQAHLVSVIKESAVKRELTWLSGEWEDGKKWDFSLRILKDLGYDFEAGRQDKSVHPFSTSMGLNDVRITTRTSPDDLFHGLMATIHECGHALYSQGHDAQDQRTPVLDGASLGIHESQSRLWENMIGRSLPFWEHYTPILQEYFPERLKAVTPQDVYFAVNQVAPTLIRVDADECTYNLHVILRFEIELDLIEGRLATRDIPESWNAKVKEYLGIEVPDDARGCLQDIHWAHGAFGYFPTYALGNLYAAQLVEKMQKDIPDFWEQVRAGIFENILIWLREHVHRHNRLKLPSELIKTATGQELSAEPFLNYLGEKFMTLYQIV